MRYIKNFLQDIAAAIKEKTSKTNKIKPENFVQEINSIITNDEPLKTQEKDVSLVSTNTEDIAPDNGYNGMTKISIVPNLQIKSVELTSTAAQTFLTDTGYAAIGNLSITPKLQDKTVTITSNTTTTVTPDSGYAGLKSVKATSNIGSSNLTYNVMWKNGASSKSGSITIPAATTRAYLIVHASTQNDFSGCSVSGTGLTITRTNSNALGDPASAVNGGYRYSVFVYLITKSAGTARTLSVTWNGNEIRHSCPILIY